MDDIPSSYARLPLHSGPGPAPAFKKSFQSLNAYEKHKAFISNYVLHYGGASEREKLKASIGKPGKTEYQILKDNHRFLRDDEEDEGETTWEQRVAKNYYDKLFKEFCIANLSKYKEGKIALRWRTHREVVEGTGQFTCANLACPAAQEGSKPRQPKLKSWEVNFAYREHGEAKNALVKLRLCEECAYMLNYRKMKEVQKEERKAEKRRRQIESGQGLDSEDVGDADDAHAKKKARSGGENDRDEVELEKDAHNGGGRNVDDPAVSSSSGKHAEHAKDMDNGRDVEGPVSNVYSKAEASRVWSKPIEMPDENEDNGKDDEMEAFFASLF